MALSVPGRSSQRTDAAQREGRHGPSGGGFQEAFENHGDLMEIKYGWDNSGDRLG